MAPILVWSAASRLVDRPLGAWFGHLSMYSFFIYVTHAPLLRMCWIVFQKAFPSVPVALFTAIAPFAVVCACIGLYKLLSAWAPVPFDWGARLPRRQGPDDTEATQHPRTTFGQNGVVK